MRPVLVTLLFAALAVTATAQTPAAAPAPATLPTPDIIQRVRPGIVVVESWRPPLGIGSGNSRIDEFFERALEAKSGEKGKGKAKTSTAPAPDDAQDDEKTDRRRRAVTSAIVLDADKGLLVTTPGEHDGAVEMRVTTANGATFPARVLGAFAPYGVAVLKTERLSIVAPRLSTRAPRPGEPVVVLGQSYDIGVAPTHGIVSGVDVPLRHVPARNLLFDAQIDLGSAGGAVADASGDVIGMVYGKYGAIDGMQRLHGFALRMAAVLDTARAIVAANGFPGGAIGIEVEMRDNAFVVANVAPGSGAARAGVQVGDVVRTLDGAPVASLDDLKFRVGLAAIGARMALGVERAGAALTLQTEVGPPPAATSR